MWTIRPCPAHHTAGLACLMLTSFDDDDALLDAIMAGAAGYVLKQITLRKVAQTAAAPGTGGGPDPVVGHGQHRLPAAHHQDHLGRRGVGMPGHVGTSSATSPGTSTSISPSMRSAGATPSSARANSSTALASAAVRRGPRR